MSTPRVAVFGSFMMDLIAYAPRRPKAGETLEGTGFTMRPGGKGFNQACAARRAGADVTMVGLLGEDHFGDQFMSELALLGIDTRSVGREARAGTGVGMPVIMPGGENSIVVVPRANGRVNQAHASEADEAIRRADVLLLQLEVPLEASCRAADIAHQAGALVVLNPAPYQSVSDELMQFVDLVTPNEVEAQQWTGSDSCGEMSDLAGRLAASLRCDAVVTAGSAGCYVARPGCEVGHVPAHRTEVVDTVGAGDTFNGNLGARLACGDELVAAVRYANAAAGLYVATASGATQAPAESEVRRALELRIDTPHPPSPCNVLNMAGKTS